MDNKNLSGKCVRTLFGQNLKRLRTKAGLSQLALAGESDLAHTFINDIENGKKWVSCDTVARLCGVLNIEPYQLFFPVSKLEEHNSEILSSYVDDLSESVLKTVEDFKNRYLN